MPLEIPPDDTVTSFALEPQPPKRIPLPVPKGAQTFIVTARLTVPPSVDYVVEILRVEMYTTVGNPNPNLLQTGIVFPDTSVLQAGNLSVAQAAQPLAVELPYVQPLQVWPEWVFFAQANVPQQAGAVFNFLNLVVWWQLRRVPYLVDQQFPHSTNLPWQVLTSLF